jgi:propanol-preferring alcohol dehydrogenase
LLSHAPKDHEAQKFAKSLGVTWAGDSDTLPPERLNAAIIFAPIGGLVPLALKAMDKGGIVVCGGIHMSDIPSFPYELLWEERSVLSIANLTRRDGEEFFAIAPRVPVRTIVQTFHLEEANEALSSLREGKLQGVAVLVV